MGGTGLRPVVSGVPPETVAGRAQALVSMDNQQRTTSDEIRRDAGFDGRDARATILKTRPTAGASSPFLLKIRVYPCPSVV